MSWIGDAWRLRAALAVDNVSGVAAGTTFVTIPQDWDVFWTLVRADGFDVRFTDSGGRTTLPYERLAGWSVPTRTGTFRVSTQTHSSSDATLMRWLYWGNAAPGGDPSVAQVAATEKTGRVLPCDGPAGFVVPYRAETPGATKPRYELAKASTETTHLWFDLDAALPRRRTKSDGQLRCGEIDYVQFQVLDTLAADQPSMYDETETRLVHPALVRTTIKAGASGTDYIASLTVKDTEGRILNPRALLHVRTVTV